MTEYAGSTQKTIDSRIEATFGASIVSRSDLCVNRTQIEQRTGLLKGYGTLARGHAGQRVVPLEIDAQIAIGRKETSFHIIQ